MDRGFFLGGGALVSCSTSRPINHIVFLFLQNTSCIKKPQVTWRGGGHTPCTLPLDPPLIKSHSPLKTAIKYGSTPEEYESTPDLKNFVKRRFFLVVCSMYFSLWLSWLWNVTWISNRYYASINNDERTINYSLPIAAALLTTELCGTKNGTDKLRPKITHGVEKSQTSLSLLS